MADPDLINVYEFVLLYLHAHHDNVMCGALSHTIIVVLFTEFVMGGISEMKVEVVKREKESLSDDDFDDRTDFIDNDTDDDREYR